MHAWKKQRTNTGAKPSYNWDKPFCIEDARQEYGWEDTDYIMGIDEAGRGSVLGSMIYAGMACRLCDHETLVGYGVDDSKALTDVRRRQMFEQIKNNDNFKYMIDEITPQDISRQQLGRAAQSLNKISHNSAIGIIADIKERVGDKLVACFVDVVGPQELYQNKLNRQFPDLVIVVRSKADSLFPVVSGASILAKVTRDVTTEAIDNDGLPHVPSVGTVGSGYPADPVAKEWLKKNTHRLFVFPNIIRFDWQPVKDIEAVKCIRVDWNGNWEGELPELFGNSKTKKWQYFQEMFLSHPSSF